MSRQLLILSLFLASATSPILAPPKSASGLIPEASGLTHSTGGEGSAIPTAPGFDEGSDSYARIAESYDSEDVYVPYDPTESGWSNAASANELFYPWLDNIKKTFSDADFIAALPKALEKMTEANEANEEGNPHLIREKAKADTLFTTIRDICAERGI